MNKAIVLTELPDSTVAFATTDNAGLAIITQLPPGTYYLRITVPNGLPAISTQTLLGSSELSTHVVGQAEVLMIVLVPIALAVLVTVFAVQRDRKRAALVRNPILVPYSPSCPRCRLPVQADVRYCSYCGTLLKSEPPSASPSII